MGNLPPASVLLRLPIAIPGSYLSCVGYGGAGVAVLCCRCGRSLSHIIVGIALYPSCFHWVFAYFAWGRRCGSSPTVVVLGLALPFLACLPCSACGTGPQAPPLWHPIAIHCLVAFLLLLCSPPLLGVPLCRQACPASVLLLFSFTRVPGLRYWCWQCPGCRLFSQVCRFIVKSLTNSSRMKKELQVLQRCPFARLSFLLLFCCFHQ